MNIEVKCWFVVTVTTAECQINCDVYLALLDEQIHETRCLEQKMQVRLQQIWNAARSEKGKSSSSLYGIGDQVQSFSAVCNIQFLLFSKEKRCIICEVRSSAKLSLIKCGMKSTSVASVAGM